MGEHLEVVVCDVCHGEDLELRLDTAAGDVDGEKYGEGDDASDQTADDRDLEEAQEEVAVHGVVLQDVCVRNLIKCGNPVEEAIR